MNAPPTRPLVSETAAATGKRGAILRAARGLFLDLPYERVSMDAVANAAGVSKVTIYAHFDDKQSLFLAAMGAECEALFVTAGEALKAEGDLRQTLATLGAQFTLLINSDEVSALYAVMMAQRTKHPDLPRQFFEATVHSCKTLLSEVFAREAMRGRLRCADPFLAAVQFLALVQGDFTHRRDLGLGGVDEQDVRAYAEACADLFLRAYAPG